MPARSLRVTTLDGMRHRLGPLAPGVKRESPVNSGQLAGFLLSFLHPEPHVHLAVHPHAGSEMLMRLLTLCRAQIQLGKADVTVGGERTHARILSEGKGVPLVANRDVEMGYRRMLRNFTKDVQGSSFVPSLSPPTCDAQRVRPELRGFIASPRLQVGVGELRCEQGVTPARCHETLQAFFLPGEEWLRQDARRPRTHGPGSASGCPPTRRYSSVPPSRRLAQGAGSRFPSLPAPGRGSRAPNGR